MRVVIVGNGVAGIEAALAVRGRQEDWPITLVSEESDHFFSRPALMYALCGQMSQRNIEPYERDLYQRMGFERVRARATGLEPGARRLQLAGGLAPLEYDRLLVACGSRPRSPVGIFPNADLKGIGSFVTMQDMQWLEAEVHGAPAHDLPERPEAHLQATAADSPYIPRAVVAQERGHLAKTAVVVGGGLIGLEAVEILRKAGLEVHFLIMEDWYWPLAIDAAESAWVAELMRHEGVHVHLKTEVDEFLDDGQGRVCGVKTKAGDEIGCDIAVVAIGVIPNTSWLEGSGIDLDERFKGVAVNASLQSSDEAVFAAGDCATVRWFNGMQRPEQLWYTSRDQGRVAARGLMGDEVGYARDTFYNSAKFMDIEYTTAGLVNFGLEGEENWFHEEKGAVRSTLRVVTQEGTVVGFNMLGRRWDHRVLVRWIDERRDLDYVLDRLPQALYDAELTPPLAIPGREYARPSFLKRLFG
jgi:NADPH-dependent 2,4-dienoyl-CoA reductase/sulfur reductase-like enzyme